MRATQTKLRKKNEASRCPRGHPLAVATGDRRCDGPCRRSVDNGTWWACAACGFDLCPECMRGGGALRRRSPPAPQPKRAAPPTAAAACLRETAVIVFGALAVFGALVAAADLLGHPLIGPPPTPRPRPTQPSAREWHQRGGSFMAAWKRDGKPDAANGGAANPLHEAVHAFSRACAVQPDEAQLWQVHAKALSNTGQDVEVLKSLDRAIALRPDDVPLRMAAATARQRVLGSAEHEAVRADFAVAAAQARQVLRYFGVPVPRGDVLDVAGPDSDGKERPAGAWLHRAAPVEAILAVGRALNALGRHDAAVSFLAAARGRGYEPRKGAAGSVPRIGAFEARPNRHKLRHDVEQMQHTQPHWQIQSTSQQPQQQRCPEVSTSGIIGVVAARQMDGLEKKPESHNSTTATLHGDSRKSGAHPWTPPARTLPCTLLVCPRPSASLTTFDSSETRPSTT